jgi:hypothetical protein
VAALHVERLGGLAGFGAGRSHIRSAGQVEGDALPPAAQQVVEQLFKASSASAAKQARQAKSLVRDGFTYRITRTTEAGEQTVEVPEAAMPPELIACVHDELI